MRISDWSSDVCSSDLRRRPALALSHPRRLARALGRGADDVQIAVGLDSVDAARIENARAWRAAEYRRDVHPARPARLARSEEHTSELQSLMRISYAVFCLKKKTKNKNIKRTRTTNSNQL